MYFQKVEWTKLQHPNRTIIQSLLQEEQTTVKNSQLRGAMLYMLQPDCEISCFVTKKFSFVNS